MVKNNGMVRRIEKMAVLPIFYKLEGRKVIIAGGSDAAAWKAELLAACGAQVHVYAETLSNVFVEKITSEGSLGSYVHHLKEWDAQIFKGAALAICDAENDEEAAKFFDAAREAGVPVNVIDNPEYCEFQFGSIVNRSPVIVSISTNGVAPILGQEIRQKIETMLPRSLSKWAQIGVSVRARVAEKLDFGAPRRRFWQRFSELALSKGPDRDARGQLIQIIDQIATNTPTRKEGKITHINFPFDDVELLTIKAVRALQSADVVLYDKEIGNDVLELARREARHILAGSDADNRLVALARRGNHVVRISGCDSKYVTDDMDKLKNSSKTEFQVDFI